MTQTKYSVNGPIFKLALEHAQSAERYSDPNQSRVLRRVLSEPGKKMSLSALQKLVDSGTYAWSCYDDDHDFHRRSNVGWLVGVDDTGSNFARLAAPAPAELGELRKQALAAAALAGAGKGKAGKPISKLVVKSLAEAIRAGDEATVAKLAPVAACGSFEEKESVYDREFSTTHPVDVAIKNENPRFLELLIPHIDVNGDNGAGSVILRAALKAGAEHANLLLAAGANAAVPDSDGATPLMASARRGDFALVNLLLPLSDAKAVDKRGESALFHALKIRDPETVKALAASSDFDAANKAGLTPLMVASDPSTYHGSDKGALERYNACVESVVDGCKNIDAVDPEGRTALMRLVDKRDPYAKAPGDDVFFDAMRAMLSRGADPRRAFANGDTVFTHCANRDYGRYVDLLLPLVDPNAPGKDGATALIIAASAANIGLVRKLLPASDPHAKNAAGCDALLALLGRSRSLDKADVLCFLRLAAVSDFNAQNDAGATALMSLMEKDEPELFDFALAKSDARLPNKDGKTALMAACTVKNPHYFNSLLPLSDAAAQDAEGRTALIHAADTVYAERIAALAKLCNANHQDAEGRTALMHAVEAGYSFDPAVVDLLLDLSDARLKDREGLDAAAIALACDREDLSKRIAALARAQEDREQLRAVSSGAAIKKPRSKSL